MTKTQVLALLKKNRNERGIENWKKLGASETAGLKTFGIGLTQLRKLARQIGRDRNLAGQLWKTDVYDAKIIGLLIDDPKQITRDQAEQQVEQLQGGMLEHVFATCDATLAKTPFAFDIACDWIKSQSQVRRRCGYALVYELSKKKVMGMDDDWYMDCVSHINERIDGELPTVRAAMGGALLGIGKRNKLLNKATLKVARRIGPIEYGDGNSCEPLDLVGHLTSDYLKKKFAR